MRGVEPLKRIRRHQAFADGPEGRRYKPAHFIPGIVMDDHALITASELEILLHDNLRGKPLYNSRLKSVRVFASASQVCGWGAEVRGDFSQLEADECRGVILEMQRNCSLEDGWPPARRRRPC